MIRPKLNQISLEEAYKNFGKPGFIITMSIGQWDKFLEEAYFRQNAILVEVGNLGKPIAAYRKGDKE